MYMYMYVWSMICRFYMCEFMTPSRLSHTATNLCFAEKDIYTQEVLLMVMQELTEQTPLPTLLMRTVLQSLAMYPKVIGLVLNILQRLVQKQVRGWLRHLRCLLLIVE